LANEGGNVAPPVDYCHDLNPLSNRAVQNQLVTHRPEQECALPHEIFAGVPHSWRFGKHS